jgi:hypothetical protein
LSVVRSGSAHAVRCRLPLSRLPLFPAFFVQVHLKYNIRIWQDKREGEVAAISLTTATQVADPSLRLDACSAHALSKPDKRSDGWLLLNAKINYSEIVEDTNKKNGTDSTNTIRAIRVIYG